MEKLKKVYTQIKDFPLRHNEVKVLCLDGSYARYLLNLDYPADPHADLEFDLYIDDKSFPNFSRNFSNLLKQSFPNLILAYKPNHCDHALVTNEFVIVEFNLNLFSKIEELKTETNPSYTKGVIVVLDRTNWVTKVIQQQMKKTVSVDEKNLTESLINDFLFHLIFAVKHIKRGELLLSRNIVILQLVNDLLKIKRLLSNKNDWWLGPVRYAEKTFEKNFIKEIGKISPQTTQKSLEQSVRASFAMFKTIFMKEIAGKYPDLGQEYSPQLDQAENFLTRKLL